jgi:hypothetical protein
MSLSDKRYEDFIGRPLTDWTLDELEQYQIRLRKPSPKIKLVIDTLQAEGVDQVSLLTQRSLDRLRRETTTGFASVGAILRATGGSQSE